MARLRHNWLEYAVMVAIGLSVGICCEVADRKLDAEPGATVKAERNVQTVRIVEIEAGEVEQYTFKDDHPNVGIRKGDSGVIVHVQVDNDTLSNPLPRPTHLLVSLHGNPTGWRIVEAVCDVGDEAHAFLLNGEHCCTHADVLMPRTEPHGSYDVLLYVHRGADAAPVDEWWVRCVGYVSAE